MNVPRTLMRIARFAAPPNRSEWLRAMVHEFPYIPASERLAFAAGCLFTSIQQRILAMTKLPPLRVVPGLLAAALMTVLCLANGLRLFGDTPTIGAILLAAGGLWIAVFGAVHAQSSERLAKFAVAGLAFYAAIGIASLVGAPAFADNSGFFGALSLEGLTLFATVLIIAHIPYFWERAKAT